MRKTVLILAFGLASLSVAFGQSGSQSTSGTTQSIKRHHRQKIGKKETIDPATNSERHLGPPTARYQPSPESEPEPGSHAPTK